MRNSYKIWSEEDIGLLKSMTQNGISMKRMQQVLGRSKRAIQHAFQNILFQQFMHHPAPKVADAYNMPMNDLVEGFVAPKYYQPLENEYEDEYPQSGEKETSNSSWLQTLMFGLFSVTSMYYYIQILHQKLPSPYDVSYEDTYRP
jgi:hypothetical protein